MKYIRRQNLNQQNALDKKVLIKPNGDIEFNPTTSVTVNGEFITVGNQAAGPEVTNVMYVTVDGDDDNDGFGEGPRQAKRTIKSACEVAQEGTTIFVRSGEYYEDNPVRIPPKVSIIGDNLRRTIIKPLNGTTKWNITFVERIDGVVTITTDVEHDLNLRDRVRVISSETNIDDECATVESVPDSMSFTYIDYGNNLTYAAATGTVERGTDLFLVNSANYIAQVVFKAIQAPAYCINIDNDAVVDTSPYIQNCSNINGPWMNNGEEWFPFITEQRNIDGDMVTGPRPLLDAELDPAYLDVYSINQRGAGGGMLIDGDRYSSVSPIKSMVADAFTQVAQGAVGFHITNFGYMQLVSCFNVFCHIAYYTTKGGYLSISNSVCDFGNFGFVADGYYNIPYDSGVILSDYYSYVASVTIDSPGSNYTLAPIVTFDPPTSPGGVQAQGTASIDPSTGLLIAISVDDPGSGYDFQPDITLTGGGANPSLVQGIATANLYKNETITISNLSNKPQVGSIVFLENDPTSYYISNTDNIVQTFTYNEIKCRRDVALILDAILTDMTFGSTYSSAAAGLSYLRSYAAKVTSLQKLQTIAGLNEARDLALSLTANLTAQTAITDNFAIVTDIIDIGLVAVPALAIPSSLTREEGYSQAAAILEANKLFVQDEITAWIAYNYSVLDYDSVTCSRDVGLIVDALCYDLMFGSNFRTITAARSYYRAAASVVTQQQKSATLAAFRYLKTIVAAKITDNPTANASVKSNMDIIINVLENGLEEIGGIVRPDPTGYSNNYKFARNLIDENKEFIKAEISAYLNINWTAVWTGLNAAGQARVQTSIGYILDALYYDITYGGNLETTIAGRAYYSFGVLQISAPEKTAILDAYDHMKTIIGDIAQNIDIVQLQGVVIQVTGLPGSAGAASDAQALVQNVIDIIDTDTYVDILPSTAWVSASLLEENTALQYARSSIQDSVIKYINANNFIYDENTCRRDIAYIIDAMIYDMSYDGNTQTANAAAAYLEGSVIAGQVEETLAAYKYWKTIVGNIVRNIEITATPGNNTSQDISISKGSPVPASGPANYAQELLQIIIDVVDHGTGYLPDPKTPPDYALGDNTLAAIRINILNNVLSIQDSVIDYLNGTYGGTVDVTLFPAVQSVTVGTIVRLHNVSTISTGGTALEYVGAGVTYNALPFFGGEPIPDNERTEINNGKCFTVTNDQVGNFRVGSIFNVNALTGEVTIDAEDISLSGLSSIGPFKRNGIFVGVVLREISDNTTLVASTGFQEDDTVPTQFAVSTYVETNYLNKVTTAAETVASSSITFDGSIAVNGGTLSTTYTNFSLVNAAATTVNFAGEATTVNIGDATGTVYINGDLQVKGGDLTTDQTTFNLLDTTATTINFGGDATVISIGKDSGTTTVNNNFKVNINSTLGDDTTVENTLNGKLISNIPDNVGSAVEFKQSTNSYLKFDTSNSLELTTFGSTPLVTFKNATDASGSTTASATFDGGVGIAKKLYVGTDLTVNGNSALGNDRAVDTHTVDGTLSINVPDNTAVAFQVKENTQTYITAVTTNGSESVTIEATPTLLVKNVTDNTLGTNASGALQVTGGVGIAKNLTVGVDLRVTGNTVMTGDLDVQGGDLTTTQTTFNLVNTTATTLNIGGASTATAIGSAVSGTTTINYDANVKHDLTVDGDVQVKGGDITTNQTTFNLVNTTATTLNIGGASTATAIGSAVSGTTTINYDANVKHDLTVDGDVQVKGGDLTTNQTTFNLLNATATTINAFGAATAITVGASGANTFTLNHNILVGSQTTQNVFNTTATTVNAFGAATTIGIGANTGTLTLNNAIVTTPGQFISTRASDLADGAGQLYLNGATGNRIDFNNNGTAAPAFTTRSAGSKIVLYPLTNSTNTDYAIGINSATFWSSVPQYDAALTFKWYGGITEIASIDGVGNQILTGDLAVNGGDLTTTQTTFNLINATATTLNIGGAATTVNLGINTGTVNIGVLALTTDLEVQYGGTGVSSFTAKGVVYGNSTSGLLVTAASNPGSNATISYGILTTDGSNVPVWTDVIDGGTY